MEREIAHPALYRFFYRWIGTVFKDLQLQDKSIIQYLSLMLSRFGRSDNLYCIKSIGCKALVTAVEMILEAEERAHPESAQFNPFSVYFVPLWQITLLNIIAK